MSKCRSNLAFAVLLVPLLVGGCVTTMKTVADFGTATTTLTGSYKPMVAGIVSTCEMRRTYRMLEEQGPYDLVNVRTTAKAECKPLADAAATANSFGEALGGYGAALSSLAGAKASALDDDIAGVSSAAQELKDKTGTATFDKTQLEAGSKLATAAVHLLNQRRIYTLTRRILEENREPLRVTVEAMKTYASRNYQGELTETHNTLTSVFARLAKSSRSSTAVDVPSRLPFRFAQFVVRADIDANEAESMKVKKFVEASDSLIKAHGELLEKSGQLTTLEQLAAVSDFVQKVKIVRDSAKSF